jgi:Flp pilus assembly protein TadG
MMEATPADHHPAVKNAASVNGPRRNSGFRLGRRGVAATEFALIAGPLFVIILAVIEACWQLATGTGLEFAALKASRYGMVGSNSPPSVLTANQANVPTCRSDNIRWMMSRATNNLVKNDSNLQVTTEATKGLAVGGTAVAGAGAGGEITTYTVTYRQPFISGIVAETL